MLQLEVARVAQHVLPVLIAVPAVVAALVPLVRRENINHLLHLLAASLALQALIRTPQELSRVRPHLLELPLLEVLPHSHSVVLVISRLCRVNKIAALACLVLIPPEKVTPRARLFQPVLIPEV